MAAMAVALTLLLQEAPDYMPRAAAVESAGLHRSYITLVSAFSMADGPYPAFFRRAVRNMVVGTLLSILPAGAFYFSTYSYTQRQFLILSALGLIDLAMFLPLDVAI